MLMHGLNSLVHHRPSQVWEATVTSIFGRAFSFLCFWGPMRTASKIWLACHVQRHRQLQGGARAVILCAMPHQSAAGAGNAAGGAFHFTWLQRHMRL